MIWIAGVGERGPVLFGAGRSLEKGLPKSSSRNSPMEDEHLGPLAAKHADANCTRQHGASNYVRRRALFSIALIRRRIACS